MEVLILWIGVSIWYSEPIYTQLSQFESDACQARDTITYGINTMIINELSTRRCT